MAGIALRHPIADHPAAHRAIGDGAQRNLTDHMLAIFDHEHYARALSLIMPLLAHPLPKRQPCTMHRIACRPRLKPIRVLPSNGIPFIGIVHIHGAKRNRHATYRRMQYERHMDGVWRTPPRIRREESEAKPHHHCAINVAAHGACRPSDERRRPESPTGTGTGKLAGMEPKDSKQALRRCRGQGPRRPVCAR